MIINKNNVKRQYGSKESRNFISKNVRTNKWYNFITNIFDIIYVCKCLWLV